MYIPSIHFALAIPKATHGLEHCTWLYVRGTIGCVDGTSVLCHCWSQNIFSSVNLKDSVTLSKPLWSDLLLEHFNIQWLDALYASTIYWFSPQMPCAGIFLELEEFDSNQPLPEFFCRCHVLVWYPWGSNLARRYEHLALLLHQLQEGTTLLTKFPHPSFNSHVLSSALCRFIFNSYALSSTCCEFVHSDAYHLGGNHITTQTML